MSPDHVVAAVCILAALIGAGVEVGRWVDSRVNRGLDRHVQEALGEYETAAPHWTKPLPEVDAEFRAIVAQIDEQVYDVERDGL